MSRHSTRMLMAMLGATVLVLGACESDTAVRATPETDVSGTTPEIDFSGTYTADIPYRDFKDVPGPTLRSFAGRWTLTLDEEMSAYQIEGGGFSRVSGHFSLQDDIAVFDDEPAPKGAFNCYIEDVRTLTEGRAEYAAGIEDNSMTLDTEIETCPLREAILERTWTRVSD